MVMVSLTMAMVGLTMATLMAAIGRIEASPTTSATINRMKGLGTRTANPNTDNPFL